MTVSRPVIGAAGLAASFLAFATTGLAESIISQCVSQFVEACGAAVSAPTSFLDAYAAREDAFVYTTPDGAMRVASATSATDLGDGAGVWQRIGVSEIDGATHVMCMFDCSLEDDKSPEDLQAETFAALQEIRPEAKIIGGALTGAAQDDLGLEWWGSHMFVATGWAQNDAQAASINLHCCGIEIQTMTGTGSTP